jgi:hypothetical protein
MQPQIGKSTGISVVRVSLIIGHLHISRLVGYESKIKLHVKLMRMYIRLVALSVSLVFFTFAAQTHNCKRVC